jgi:hypothetical protein
MTRRESLAAERRLASESAKEKPRRGAGASFDFFCAVPGSYQWTPGTGDLCGFQLFRVKDANLDAAKVSDRGRKGSPDLVFAHHLHPIDQSTVSLSYDMERC